MNRKKNDRIFRAAAVAAAAVLVLGLSAFGVSRLNTGGVVSIVMLDVNPSIELKLDRNREVLQANALNEDARRILDGMKLKGTDVNTAANAIIGSLLRHGYMDELANSILISVEDADRTRGETLRTELTEEIGALLEAASVNAAILAQYVEDDAARELADTHHISEGKAALIRCIRQVNPTYPEVELAALSVHELNLILSNPKNEVRGVTTAGTASDSAYIGKKQALAAALAHADVAENAASRKESEFDFENGKLVYEVAFAAAGREYEYDIDARTGEVVKHRCEYDDDTERFNGNGETAGQTGDAGQSVPSVPQKPSAGDIGAEKARDTALAHAGVALADVRGLEVERAVDDGRVEYKVEFRVGAVEYEYEISAVDGRILEYDRGADD